MGSFRAALRFLTILPFPSGRSCEEKLTAGAVFFFPVVGLVIGFVAMGVLAVCRMLFPPLLAAVLAVLTLLKISGGLHMDGLSDTADGFFSCRSREKMLEIMRDSRVGAMGVMAIVAALLIKTASLASMPQTTAIKAVLLMPLAGRCAIVINMAFLTYAREEGLAGVFCQRRPIAAALLGFLLFICSSYIILRGVGLAAVLGTLAGNGMFVWYCSRKIGGFTGDTLGAASELAEVFTGLVLAAGPLQMLG